MGRRLLLALALGALLTACVTACGVAPPKQSDDDAQLASMKAAAHIADCVTGQTSDGGLPSYTLPCLGGGTPVALSTLKGPLLLNLWAPNCGPCREEMPALEAFYQRYGRTLPVLGVNTLYQIPRIALQTAITRGITFPLVDDGAGDLQGTSLSVHGLPTTYLLTADGHVKFVSAGGMKDEAEVVRKVEAALGAPL